MIESRKIEDLHPVVQAMCRKFIEECEKVDIEIILTSTYRDKERQDALYAKGRLFKGAKVTNAKGGQSFHNWRVAFDVVPMEHGKPDWDNEQLWLSIGHIGKTCGLEWGGDFRSFKDKPHFQYTGGLTLADFNHGKTLSEVIC